MATSGSDVANEIVYEFVIPGVYGLYDTMTMSYSRDSNVYEFC